MDSRKPISFYNRSNYFNPDTSKSIITVSSPSAFSSKVQKQEGYELRLYWEFRNCVDHDGQVFYYTLTYNDKSLPYFEGVPCFDYNDIAYFLNGGLRKILLRLYGTRLRYFVGAELGEGAGKRGMENNPHYHVLFYLMSANNPRYQYKKITPIEFRSLVRAYWQGFDQDKVGYQDFRTAKFGIAKEGENIGLVSDFRAVSYVCKYVTKDVSIIKAEKLVKKHLFEKYYWNTYYSQNVQYSFFVDTYQRVMNIDDLPEYSTEFSELCRELAPILYSQYGVRLDEDMFEFFDSFLSESHLVKSYEAFVISQVEDNVRFDFNIFRNRYSNKCRISQGVGLYGLDFFDEGKQTIDVPTKYGFKSRQINLYYYRKLYYDIVKDPLGQNIYVLNERGIDMKVKNLERSATCLTDRIVSIYNSVDYETFKELSSLYPDCVYFTNFDDFIAIRLNPKIFKDYAYFKLVYEGRFFKNEFNQLDKSFVYPSLDFVSDYREFLKPSYYTTRYDPDGLVDFLKDDSKVYSSYSIHPYFVSNKSIFDVFDILLEYFYCSKDKFLEDSYNEIRSVKRFFDKLKLKSYYSNFKF